MMNPLRFLCARGSRMLIYSLGISVFLGLPAPGVAGQDVLLGMNDVDQPGGPDELVSIDLPSGVASHLHFFDPGMNFLESLAYDARENVLWTTNDGVLFRVDPKTFAATEIGDTGKSDIDGLTVHPSTGQLYGITHGGNDLLLIDKSDAGINVINGGVEQGSRLEDLTFDPTGRLFILTSRALVEVDPIDGSRILKARLNGASSLEGLIWWNERGVFLSAADRGRNKDLVTVDFAGNVAFLPETSGFRDIEALAFVPGDTEVPVALQATGIERDRIGVHLRWSSPDVVPVFVVQRSLHAAGPWEAIGELRPSILGEPHDASYQFTDLQAADLRDVALHYRVGAQDEEGVWTWVHYELQASVTPAVSMLQENAPNPFNPLTTFRVDLAQAETVMLQVFDIRGRLVHRQDAFLPAGAHGLVWDGRDRRGNALPSGVYPYVLRAGQEQLRSRAVLAK